MPPDFDFDLLSNDNGLKHAHTHTQMLVLQTITNADTDEAE